jgi:hypothetical protein
VVEPLTLLVQQNLVVLGLAPLVTTAEVPLVVRLVAAAERVLLEGMVLPILVMAGMVLLLLSQELRSPMVVAVEAVLLVVAYLPLVVLVVVVMVEIPLPLAPLTRVAVVAVLLLLHLVTAVAALSLFAPSSVDQRLV